jgi:L-ascorbate metabolism protein UlaG (beta-lactamase superfamily)
MATQLTWLGHGTWLLETAGGRVLLDPFLDDNPAAPCKAADVQAEFILVSHGHFDHTADVESIARRCDALVIATFEVCEWFAKRGLRTHAQNIGGACAHRFGRVKLTIAHHSSTMPDGAPGGDPAGFLLELPEGRVYFACDTGLFGDMQGIGRGGLELAVLPIGDNYTMGPDDALEAVKLLAPRRVVPAHYDTWPPIAQDAAAWAQRVRAETAAEPIVLRPGEKLTL